MRLTFYFGNHISKAVPIFTVIFVAVIFLLVILGGISSGKKSAQANLIIQNAQNLSGALYYFYGDQDRFPTVLEFQNKDIMLNYLSSFPPADFISETCPENYIYKRPSSKSFELFFCLPKGAQEYSTGWNKYEAGG